MWLQKRRTEVKLKCDSGDVVGLVRCPEGKEIEEKSMEGIVPLRLLKRSSRAATQWVIWPEKQEKSKFKKCYMSQKFL